MEKKLKFHTSNTKQESNIANCEWHLAFKTLKPIYRDIHFPPRPHIFFEGHDSLLKKQKIQNKTTVTKLYHIDHVTSRHIMAFLLVINIAILKRFSRTKNVRE